MYCSGVILSVSFALQLVLSAFSSNFIHQHVKRLFSPFVVVEDVQLELDESFEPQCKDCDQAASYVDGCEPVQDEDEGCDPDDPDYKRCVYYSFDYKEVSIYQYTVLDAGPRHGETESEDMIEYYHWDCESESWESDGGYRSTSWNRWANGTIDAPALQPTRRTWENSWKDTYAEFDSDFVETWSSTEGGEQTKTFDVINGMPFLVHDRDTTFTEPPRVTEGYDHRYSFNNQGYWTKEDKKTYSINPDGSQKVDTHIRERYNSGGNANGILNKCKETRNGTVLYDNFCPFPSIGIA